MVKLFFDIETIPCEKSKKEEFLAVLRAKNGKKNGEPLSDDKLFRDMALDGAFGRICCIGYIKEDGTITKDVLKGTEKEILEKFWEIAKDVELFVGHNIYEFDLPFIYKRSIINGVKPRDNVSFRRYISEPIYDTMKEWEKWANGKTSLHTLSVVLGFPTSKGEMDGSKVWDAYLEGRIDDICKYCMKDIELTRQIYYKMTFLAIPKELKPVEEELF